MVIVPEQRGSTRVKFTGITLVYSDESEVSCVAKNVSESGILVLPREPHSIQEGESLYLTFILPDAPAWLKLKGEVVRRTKAHDLSGLAIEFRGPAFEAQTELQKYAMTGGAKAVVNRRNPAVPPPLPESIGLENASAGDDSAGDDSDGDDSTVPWARDSVSSASSLEPKERTSTIVAPPADQEQLVNSCVEREKQRDTQVIAEEDLFVLRVETINPSSDN